MQALLMAKGSLRGCSPALSSLLLGMGVCGGKFHGYLQKLQHDAEDVIVSWKRKTRSCP